MKGGFISSDSPCADENGKGASLGWAGPRAGVGGKAEGPQAKSLAALEVSRAVHVRLLLGAFPAGFGEIDLRFVPAEVDFLRGDPRLGGGDLVLVLEFLKICSCHIELFV